jgi:hypothetical protein
MACMIGRITIGRNEGTINFYLGTVNNFTSAASTNAAGNNGANGSMDSNMNASAKISMKKANKTLRLR